MSEETQDLKQSLERLLDVTSRRRWWVLSTFFIVTLSAIAAAFVIPAKYKSEATIVVEQQQVPDRYVTPTSTSDLLQALQAMTQEILSRSRLLQIISQFDLYPSQRKRMGPDELVEMMKKDIEIEPLLPSPERRSANAFKITFLGSSPATSRDVVSRLTSLFIVENLKAREVQAKGTTTFLENQLEAARAGLQLQEKRLRDFKMQHLGELPDEEKSNLQILSGLQMQLQNSMASLGRAHEQQVYLESLLAQYHSLSPKSEADPTAVGPTRIAAVEKELTDLRTKRAELLAHYTPQHPDVVNMNQQIAQTESLLESLKSKSQNSPAAPVTAASAIQISPDDDPAVAQIKSQLKANQVEIQNNMAAEKQLQSRIAEYQRRLSETPVREQEISDMMRDYTLAQQNYADLESKKTQAALATRLVQNQQGEQFRIVDPASLPTRPFIPDRRKFAAVGCILGLVLGVVAAWASEAKDTSFHSEKEASQLLALPIVFGVPLFLTPREERRASRKRVWEWVSGSVLVTAVLLVEVIIFLRG